MEGMTRKRDEPWLSPSRITGGSTGNASTISHITLKSSSMSSLKACPTEEVWRDDDDELLGLASSSSWWYGLLEVPETIWRAEEETTE
jgi:hypothetical protein